MRSELMMAAVAAFVVASGSARAQSRPSAAPPPVAPPSSDPTATPAPTLGVKPPTVTFEDAIQRATSHNPTFEVAYDEVRRAQALVEQARSSWLPTLNANAEYTRLDADRTIGTTVIAGQDSVNANLTLIVPIVAPRGWVATARAKDNKRIAKAVLEDTRRQVALLAGRAYLTVIGQKRVLESSIQARDTARAHEQFSQSRLAGGVGNRLDAVRAAQERASTETTVQTQTLALSRAQEALGILLGENTPLDAADVAARRPPRWRRRSTRRSGGATSWCRRNAWSLHAKRCAIRMRTTCRSSPASRSRSTRTRRRSRCRRRAGRSQLLFTLPLYDGGNRYGLKHERDALYDEAKTRLDEALRQARSEVRIGFEAVQRSDEALVQARDAARFAQEALELSQLAYRAGATTNIEVVDAERRARDAAIDAAIAEDAARQARLDLLSAAGRFPVTLGRCERPWVRKLAGGGWAGDGSSMRPRKPLRAPGATTRASRVSRTDERRTGADRRTADDRRELPPRPEGRRRGGGRRRPIPRTHDGRPTREPPRPAWTAAQRRGMRGACRRAPPSP